MKKSKLKRKLKNALFQDNTSRMQIAERDEKIEQLECDLMLEQTKTKALEHIAKMRGIAIDAGTEEIARKDRAAEDSAEFVAKVMRYASQS